jgi:hypothetical protein
MSDLITSGFAVELDLIIFGLPVEPDPTSFGLVLKPCHSPAFKIKYYILNYFFLIIFSMSNISHVNDNFTPIAYLIITFFFFQQKLYHYIILIHKYLYLDKQQKINSKTTSSFSL